jgi:hypothetical protein
MEHQSIPQHDEIYQPGQSSQAPIRDCLLMANCILVAQRVLVSTRETNELGASPSGIYGQYRREWTQEIVIQIAVNGNPVNKIKAYLAFLGYTQLECSTIERDQDRYIIQVNPEAWMSTIEVISVTPTGQEKIFLCNIDERKYRFTSSPDHLVYNMNTGEYELEKVIAKVNYTSTYRALESYIRELVSAPLNHKLLHCGPHAFRFIPDHTRFIPCVITLENCRVPPFLVQIYSHSSMSGPINRMFVAQQLSDIGYQVSEKNIKAGEWYLDVQAQFCLIHEQQIAFSDFEIEQ